MKKIDCKVRPAGGGEWVLTLPNGTLFTASSQTEALKMKRTLTRTYTATRGRRGPSRGYF